MVLVFTTLTALGLLLAVVQWVVYATTGVILQADATPSLLTVLYGLVSTALYAGVLVLLFRPDSRRWLDERTGPAALGRPAASRRGGRRRSLSERATTPARVRSVRMPTTPPTWWPAPAQAGEPSRVETSTDTVCAAPASSTRPSTRSAASCSARSAPATTR